VKAYAAQSLAIWAGMCNLNVVYAAQPDTATLVFARAGTSYHGMTLGSGADRESERSIRGLGLGIRVVGDAKPDDRLRLAARAIRGKTDAGDPYPASITSMTKVAEDGRTRWLAEGQKTLYSGKQFWWSKHEPGFEEIIDTRGKDDVESPLGEWTRVECICAGKRITIIVNGTTVNECYDVFPSAGKILLESEGFEILFRKLELHPLPR
jgi:hypothetical protein